LVGGAGSFPALVIAPKTSRGHHNILEITTMLQTTFTASNVHPVLGQVDRTIRLSWAFVTQPEAITRYRWVGAMTVALAQLAFWSAVWVFAKTKEWVDTEVSDAQDLSLPVEAVEPLTVVEVVDATAKALATVAVFGTNVFSVAYSAVTLVVIGSVLLGAYLLDRTPVWAGRAIAFALCVEVEIAE
jgi:hypothetical protein